jgi:hypothetical protein
MLKGTVILALTAVVVIFWGAIFLVFFQSDGASVLDLFLGEFEPLPQPLNEWQKLEGEQTDAEGVLEVRRLYEPGRGGGVLTIQRRVRHRETGIILRVLDEERVRRRRKRS